MLLAINCDASFSRQYQVGGWAFWIGSDIALGRRSSGKFTIQPLDSTTAEMQCIANALTIALNEYGPDLDIELYTDSMNAKQMIEGEASDLKYLQSINYVRSIIKRCRSFSIKHVKAHTIRPGKIITDPHILANDWCDKAARAHMRDAAKKVKYDKSFKTSEQRTRKKSRADKLRQKAEARRVARARPVPYKRSNQSIYG